MAQSVVKACAFALFPHSTIAASLSLLQLRAQKTLEAIRTGSCDESGAGTSYFLGNSYIELGISPVGDFGTRCTKPAGFHGASTRSSIGMTAAYSGFGGAGPFIDYFLPGSPEERFGIGFRTGGASGAVDGGSNSQLMGKADISITSMTLGSESVEFEGNLKSKVAINCKYTLLPGDKHFTTEVKLTNVASEKLFDVRYHRSFDPDNTKDAGGAYSTNNQIVSTRAAGDKVTAVSATSSEGDSFQKATGQLATIFFATADDRAVGYVGGFSNDYSLSYTNAVVYSSPQAKGYTHTGDEAIQLTFGVGDLEVGASTDLRYITSLNYVDRADDIGSVAEASTDKADVDVTGSSTDVSASGDPHMINVNGDSFDLYRTGVWEFLRMPKEASSSEADFKLEANVTNIADESNQCTKALYITRFSLGGSWLTPHPIDVRVLDGQMRVSMGREILTPSPKAKFTGNSPHGYVRLDMPKEGMLTIRIGSATIAIGVDKKPVHAYLNMEATGVGSLGSSLGGLLGSDDHSWISMRPASCSDAYTASHLVNTGSDIVSTSTVRFS